MSTQYQFRIPDPLHHAITQAKALECLNKPLSYPEWYELASIVLLGLLGQCSDFDHARALLGVPDGTSDDGRMKLAMCFKRLIEGKGL